MRDDVKPLDILFLSLFACVSVPDRIPAPASKASLPPDVLVVIVDDVGWPDLESVPTPAFDSLRARGVTFRRFYVNPWCAPTRDSFLRSSYAGEYRGAGCDGLIPSNALAPGTPTIGSWFQERGYTTAWFGKWHIGPSSDPSVPWECAPQQIGFDTWRAGISEGTNACGGSGYKDWLRADPCKSSFATAWADVAINKALISWWRATPSPRFAVLAYQEAHAPYMIPPTSLVPAGWPKPTTKRERYEAMLVAMDELLGAVLGTVGDETWVVLFGDNGTPGCHPATGSCEASVAQPFQDPFKLKATTFEGGIRTPMLVAAPALSGGAETDALAHVADIWPTLAAGLGMQVTTPVDGVSLVPVLHSPGSSGPRAWAFSRNPTIWGGLGDRAVIESRWKLRNVAGSEELYDLVNDPDELVNLVNDPARVAELTRLRRTMAGLP